MSTPSAAQPSAAEPQLDDISHAQPLISSAQNPPPPDPLDPPPSNLSASPPSTPTERPTPFARSSSSAHDRDLQTGPAQFDLLSCADGPRAQPEEPARADREDPASTVSQQAQRRGLDWWIGVLFCAVVLPIFISLDYSHDVCVTSAHSGTLEWVRHVQREFSAQGLPGRSPKNVHILHTIDTEETDFGVWDKLRLLRGCPLFVVDSVGRFLSRNPLEKHQQTRFYLQRSSATVLLVNGTCDLFIRLINDGRTGRDAECRFDRQKTFRDFRARHVNHLTGSASVYDVPADRSTAAYFLKMFTQGPSGGAAAPHEPKDTLPSDPQSATPHGLNAAQHAAELAKLLATAPSSYCPSGRRLHSTFPRFQFALVGHEGAGKSTTLYWLASHLGLPEALKNTFTSAESGASFTRGYNQVPFSASAVLADTMGLPNFHERYLCDLHHLMSGRNFRPGEAMVWKGACPSYFRRPTAPQPEAAAHALLFVLRYTEDPAGIDELRSLIAAMRRFPGLDLTDRVVFAVSHATDSHLRPRGTKWTFARALEVSELDLFPLNTAETVAGDGPVFVPAGLYVPLARRLMEKACVFYNGAAPAEPEPGPMANGLAGALWVWYALRWVWLVVVYVVGWLWTVCCLVVNSCIFAAQYLWS